MADITYSIDADGDETTFSASTPEGEEFIGGSVLLVPIEQTQDYLETARAAGLVVLPYP
jgi:hypothetical protein